MLAIKVVFFFVYLVTDSRLFLIIPFLIGHDTVEYLIRLSIFLLCFPPHKSNCHESGSLKSTHTPGNTALPKLVCFFFHLFTLK